MPFADRKVVYGKYYDEEKQKSNRIDNHYFNLKFAAKVQRKKE